MKIDAIPVIRTCLLAAAAAPLLMLMASIIGIASGDLSTSGWAGGVQILAMAAYALGFVGISVFIAAGSLRFGIALVLTGALVASAGAGFGVDLIHASAFGERLPSPPDWVDGSPLLFFPGLLFPLWFVLAAIGLVRVGLVRTELAVLLALGGVLFPLGRVPEVPLLILASDLVLVVALGWVVVRLLPQSSIALELEQEYADEG